MVESSLTTLIDIDDDLGEGCHKYCGTVVGNDDFVYGIPYYNAKRIIKFDPANPDTNGMGWGDPIIGVDRPNASSSLTQQIQTPMEWNGMG